MTRGHAVAWWGMIAASGAFAAVAIVNWVDALVSGRPVLYGEGMVAHAAMLLRAGGPYADTSGSVAANYPPLYLLLAAPDPFHVGRAMTMLSALGVAGLLWWRSGATRLVRAGIVATWLAMVPVALWGAAVRVDMLAVALTVAGVSLLDRATARTDARAVAIAGGALLAAAVWAKPTAALPALTVLAFLAGSARRAFVPAVAGGAAVAAIALAHAATLGIGDVWTHVVTWNAALMWSVEQLVLVLVAGGAMLGLLVAVAVHAGALRAVPLAYLVGAVGVALLGGREGATINYLLDLSAATAYALASVAPALAGGVRFPVLAVAQLTIAVAVFSPFGIVPGREPTTGAWGARERLDLVRALPRDRVHLVEDSGLLIATGHEVAVDDVFLWSRLVDRGRIDAGSLVGRVRRGEFATVVSEIDLAALDDAPAFARARWHPDLRAAVFSRYELRRTLEHPVSGRPLLWVYEPR